MARKAGARALVPQVLPASASPFEPTKLDPMLQAAVSTLEDAVADWNSLRPLVEDFFATFKAKVELQKAGNLKPGQAHQVMQSLTSILERQSRIMTNMAKSTDVVARLRQFLSGGDMGPPNLAAKSDRELEEIVRRVHATFEPEVAGE